MLLSRVCLKMNPNDKSIGVCLEYGIGRLKASGIESSCLDAQLLLMHASGLNKVELYTKNDMILNDIEYNNYMEYIERRFSHEPMAYIIGKCEFMGLTFFVNRATLIPRPDTEILAEKAIELIKANRYEKIVDIGVGSGALSVAICHECREVFCTAADISSDAVAMAKKNAFANGVMENIEFVQSDVYENINGRFDAVISNPPYIESEVINGLEDDVRLYEPHSALDGGIDGLDFYRRLISDAEKHLNPRGHILLEIGFNQAESVKALLNYYDFADVEIYNDLSGLNRVVTAKCPQTK